MWRIARDLYLGDARDARDRSLLEECGITHVLNCAYDVPCYHADRFAYLHLPLADPDPEFADCIADLCDFIAAGLEDGAVLVHCRLALSRSPAAILAYLCHVGMSLEQGLALLRAGVGEKENFVAPSEVFLEQVREYFADRES
jgi:protein-tyrosine phosphatase